jgi:lysophospholipase L1-like esterase
VNKISFRCAAGVFALSGLLFLCVNSPQSLAGQEPGNVPETTASSSTKPAPQPPSSATQVKHPDNEYWREHDAELLTDFAQLGHYKEANLKVAPPAPGENRVVFMGDSLTEGWHFEAPGGVFAAKPYINRGISGQTTSQMVLRFHQDVIALEPKAVVILGGTNDVAGNTGPMTPEGIEANLAAMAEMAVENHIRVVLCSILPAYDFDWAPGLNPAPKIIAINEWIKDYAAKHGHVYVDYHSAMKDERGGLPAKLSQDGVHPLPAGYEIMAPLAQAGVEKALAR